MSRKSQKFYAVKKGKVPGIYFTWDDCKANVEGFTGAEYKSFTSLDDAHDYIVSDKASIKSEKSVDLPDGPYSFVDGSFNSETGVYGYGGFLDVNGRRYPLEGHGDLADLAAMRNVAGEITGAMAAVSKAEELGLRHITVLYDYMGIEKWATDAWKAEKPGTADYKAFMQAKERSVSVSFQKVAAHTGIEGNEMADVMAKHAVGVPLTKKQQILYEQAYVSGQRDGVSLDTVLAVSEKEFGE